MAPLGAPEAFHHLKRNFEVYKPADDGTNLERAGAEAPWDVESQIGWNSLCPNERDFTRVFKGSG
jgi:hypothetical protein